MTYIFVNKGDSTKGTVFSIENNKKEKIETVDLASARCPLKYRIVACCQLIAEGQTIDKISKISWAPELIEFYSYIEKEPLWKSWYNDACKIRAKTLVDHAIDKLNKADPEKLELAHIKEIVKMLKDIAEEASGIRSITNVEVWEPKILQEKNWSNKNEN